MSIRRLWLVLSAVALLAAPARADVQLVAPRAGDHLDGGRQATLTWTADELPKDVEEWEAFLSIDGGEYYAIRVTPHLDEAVRSVTWRVPNVATTHARLMLRIGDETDERIIELPQTFTIEPTVSTIDLASLESGGGEPAIPGGEPTIEWVSPDSVTHRRAALETSNEPALAARAFLERFLTPVTTPRFSDRASCATVVHDVAQFPRVPAVVRPVLLLTTPGRSRTSPSCRESRRACSSI